MFLNTDTSVCPACGMMDCVETAHTFSKEFFMDNLENVTQDQLIEVLSHCPPELTLKVCIKCGFHFVPSSRHVTSSRIRLYIYEAAMDALLSTDITVVNTYLGNLFRHLKLGPADGITPMQGLQILHNALLSADDITLVRMFNALCDDFVDVAVDNEEVDLTPENVSEETIKEMVMDD